MKARLQGFGEIQVEGKRYELAARQNVEIVAMPTETACRGRPIGPAQGFQPRCSSNLKSPGFISSFLQ
jgi:hypothetical protein